jgi:hypothetical protein
MNHISKATNQYHTLPVPRKPRVIFNNPVRVDKRVHRDVIFIGMSPSPILSNPSMDDLINMCKAS